MSFKEWRLKWKINILSKFGIKFMGLAPSAYRPLIIKV